ncbi:hypothetical protein BpHYR1_038537 [Brachionus plicatilis]|uniref:Uncharacterized protein n=1 Tax=Brachionus plicatilis TaxID=10195 RepID=A0A3M7P3D5_BRAPC|nr:hypothetical protein BpHYR1_038537 [Brachionus plicatilis]
MLVALELEQVFDQVYEVELEALRHFVAACGYAGQQILNLMDLAQIEKDLSLKLDAATLSAVCSAAHQNEAFYAAQRHQLLPVAATVKHRARDRVFLEVFGADVVGGEPLECRSKTRVFKKRSKSMCRC